MNKNRFAAPAAIAAGLILLSLSVLAGADSVRQTAAQTPRAASPAAQQNKDQIPLNDFAGLNFTDEQKAEIDKIHREIEQNKAAVAQDDKLNSDQKDAMLFGYTRIEYGRTFKVLSPEQQRQVRQRILARKAAEPASRQKQLPPQN